MLKAFALLLCLTAPVSLACAGSAFAQPDMAGVAQPGANPPAYGAAQGASGGFDPAMRGAMRQMRQACAADMQTFCPDVRGAGPSGDRRADRQARRACMMDNLAKFSPQCRDALAQMRTWRQAHPHDQGWRGHGPDSQAPDGQGRNGQGPDGQGAGGPAPDGGRGPGG